MNFQDRLIDDEALGLVTNCGYWTAAEGHRRHAVDPLMQSVCPPKTTIWEVAVKLVKPHGLINIVVTVRHSLRELLRKRRNATKPEQTGAKWHVLPGQGHRLKLEKVFGSQAIAAMKTLQMARAMELFKDLEELWLRHFKRQNRDMGRRKGRTVGLRDLLIVPLTLKATPVLFGSFNIIVACIVASPSPQNQKMKRHLVTNVLLGPEEKKDQVQNPSGYLKAAIKRETPPAASFQGNAHDEGKVHRRASWLNANVFPDRPIDEEVPEMVLGKV